jgi:hypothetical protein
MNTNRLHIRTTLLAGMAVCLILPGVLSRMALGTAHAGAKGASRQDRPSRALDTARVAALTKLQAERKAGTPFSHEESDILGRFSAGGGVDALEADVLISRVLYTYYIEATDLTADGQALLARYKEHIAPRKIKIADLKAHIRAAELKAPPRAPGSAPTNDLCSGAEVIPTDATFPFYFTAITADITDATTVGDPPAPSCQSNISRSIWYRYRPGGSSAHTFSACAETGAGTTVDDTVIAIYTSPGGCAGPFTEIPTEGFSHGCDDDSCGSENLQSVVSASLPLGTEYFIVVWKFGPGAPTAGNTAVQLRVNQNVLPPNESCNGRILLALNTAVSGSTNAITVNDYQLTGTDCFTGFNQAPSAAAGRDVVYSFTPLSAGNYSFTVNFVNGFDAVLYVSTACFGSPPEQTITCSNALGPVIAASNRNSNTVNASESVQCLALAAGQQVHVFVDETAVSAVGGSFFIKVTQCATPTGDEIEPNLNPQTASALACGAQGRISPAGDVDFYQLGTPAAGSRVFALLDGASAFDDDLDLRITNATDTLEYDDAQNDTPFGFRAPNVAGRTLTGAASFIRINHATPSVQDEPYRLFSVVQPPGPGITGSSATSEVEPNNTIGQANSATNNFFFGTMSAASDIDLYCFTATAGDILFLSADWDPLRDLSPFNGALALLDLFGVVLMSVDDGSNGTSSNISGAGSFTATTPSSPADGFIFNVTTTGTYYARVTHASGTPGDYLLSISKNCEIGGGGCSGVVVCDAITFPANISQTNDPNQCGALVSYPVPSSSGSCGTINCSPASGSFFPVGTTTVSCASQAGPTCSFAVSVTDDQEPSIICTPNRVLSNDVNQCGTVLNYPPPTVIPDNCRGTFTTTCNPPSGAFFPVGTTNVTCEVDEQHGQGKPKSCTFTVTVNDTQPPVITCPPNQTAATATINAPCAVVNFTTTASDNCPGVVVACNPPSASCFPVGVTTVTCTATDASANTATCSFTVSVFNGRLQDDSAGCSNTVLFNTLTGDYRWCCNGTIYTGRASVGRIGDNYTLTHNAADRRVLIKLSGTTVPPTGTGSVQSPPGSTRCTIMDRDTRNDTCICGVASPPPVKPN